MLGILLLVLLAAGCCTAPPAAPAYPVLLCGGKYEGVGPLANQAFQCIPTSKPRTLMRDVEEKWPSIINTTAMYNFPSAVGLVPWIIPMDDSRPDQRGTFRNGGLPMRANLTAHVATLQSQVAAAIPDPNFSGACVIDYESWAPLWPAGDAANFGRWSQPALYRNASLKFVSDAHPTWTPAEVEVVAEREWESSAIIFLRTTLLAARAVRPQCAWGLYGYPPRNQCAGSPPGSMHCPYSYRANTSYLARLQAMNDATVPILAAATGLFPSLYEAYGSTEAGVAPTVVADHVATVMTETKVSNFNFHHSPSVLGGSW